MEAIIRSGGKQYRVKTGDVIDVELIPAKEGETISFEEVLLMWNEEETHLGQPLVKGGIVKGKFLGEEKGEKVIAFKYKRRKNYRRKVGHRQKYSRFEIVEVQMAS